jgi:hypothetical protein
LAGFKKRCNCYHRANAPANGCVGLISSILPRGICRMCLVCSLASPWDRWTWSVRVPDNHLRISLCRCPATYLSSFKQGSTVSVADVLIISHFSVLISKALQWSRIYIYFTSTITTPAKKALRYFVSHNLSLSNLGSLASSVRIEKAGTTSAANHSARAT